MPVHKKAHLTIFSKSAPENPGVPRAKTAASTSGDRLASFQYHSSDKRVPSEVITFLI